MPWHFETRNLRNLFVALLLGTTAFAGTNRTQHIVGIAHVAVRVSDISASLRFYQNLGFERSFEFTANGAPTEEFLKINDRQFIELYPNKSDQHLGLMHVCFESDDLAALRQAYVEAGLSPPEIKRGGAGNDLFSLHRPDGAVIEFTQYQPASMHMKDVGLHLGPNRISDRLADVLEPVSDPGVALRFYKMQLGLGVENAVNSEIRIPSTTSLHLGFTSTGIPMRLVFAVASMEHTKQTLGEQGIRYSEPDRGVVAKDPDGNEVIFVDHL